MLSSDQNRDLSQFMQNGSGAKVTNVFNISAGVAGTVRAEIMKAIPTINRLTLSSVESAMRNGGATSRAAGLR